MKIHQTPYPNKSECLIGKHDKNGTCFLFRHLLKKSCQNGLALSIITCFCPFAKFHSQYSEYSVFVYQQTLPYADLQNKTNKLIWQEKVLVDVKYIQYNKLPYRMMDNDIDSSHFNCICSLCILIYMLNCVYVLYFHNLYCISFHFTNILQLSGCMQLAIKQRDAYS